MCRLAKDVLKSLYMNNIEKIEILTSKLSTMSNKDVNFSILQEKLKDAQFNAERLQKHL